MKQKSYFRNGLFCTVLIGFSVAGTSGMAWAAAECEYPVGEGVQITEQTGGIQINEQIGDV